MSGVEAEDIIANVIAQMEAASPSAIAAHVVSVLAASGHTIMPSDDVVRTYQAASTLGRRYMLPKNFGCDREEAERWFKLHQSALDGLPGVDTVRLEYRDEFATGWLPLLAAAAAAEEDQ